MSWPVALSNDVLTGFDRLQHMGKCEQRFLVVLIEERPMFQLVE
jgi:hypothetical protein